MEVPKNYEIGGSHPLVVSLYIFKLSCFLQYYRIKRGLFMNTATKNNISIQYQAIVFKRDGCYLLNGLLDRSGSYFFF